jgi:hypothetical protein
MDVESDEIRIRSLRLGFDSFELLKMILNK